MFQIMRGIEANPLNIIRFICEIPFFRVFRYFTYNIMLCKYLMASRMTYQNTGPKASRKLQCVRLPDSEGRRVNILAKLPEETCDICYVKFLNKNNVD